MSWSRDLFIGCRCDGISADVQPGKESVVETVPHAAPSGPPDGERLSEREFPHVGCHRHAQRRHNGNFRYNR